MKALLLTLVTCLPYEGFAQGLSYADSCQISDSARTLCDAEARLTNALLRNDADQLAQIYADEFRLINYRGTVVDKAAVLNAIRTGALRFDSLTSSELQMRLYGNAGIIRGRQHQLAREPGAGEKSHPADVRFTHVYIQRDGKWLLVASQITPVLSAKSPK